MNHERHAVDAHHADRRQLLERIERELLGERVDGELRPAAEIERVAVIGRTRGKFGADDASRAASVVDDERLTEHFRQPRGGQPGKRVADPAGAIGHDDLHGTGRPILRGRRAEAEGCADQRIRRHHACGAYEPATASVAHLTFLSVGAAGTS